MNERIMRAAPNSFAEFLTAFEERGVKVCPRSRAIVVAVSYDGTSATEHSGRLQPRFMLHGTYMGPTHPWWESSLRL